MVAVVWKSKENAGYSLLEAIIQSEDRWCISYFVKEGGNQECRFFFLGLYIHLIFSREGRNPGIHLSLKVFTANLPAPYRPLYRYLEMLADSRNRMVFSVRYMGGLVGSGKPACLETHTILLLMLVLWELACVFQLDNLKMLFPQNPQLLPV